MSKLALALSVLSVILIAVTGFNFFTKYQQTQEELKLLKSELSKLDQKFLDEKNSSNSTSNTATNSATQSAQIKIGLRNGTKKVGLTGRYEPDIKRYLKDSVITSKENASKNDYDRTIVVVLNESDREKAKSLAKELKASLESLPAGEDKPENIDILIIFGKDKS